MRNRQLLLITAFLTVFAASGQWGEARAQRSRPSMQSRVRKAVNLIQKDIKATQKELATAQQEWGQAAGKLAQAESNFKTAQNDVEKAKKTLHDRVGPKVGLSEAIAALERAENDYEQAVAKRVSSLASDEQFQQLKRSKEVAEEKLTALRQSESASTQAKKTASKEFLQAKEAYLARLDQDPAVKPAKDRVQQADAHLKEVRKKLSEESKSDPELHTAELSFKQAKNELQKSQNMAAAAEAKVEALQERQAANYAALGQ